MGSAILRVLVLLLVIAYCVLFTTWNSEYVTVAGLEWFGERYVQQLPLGYLPLIGAAIGGLVMAIFTWGEWAVQKRRADTAGAQVAKAKTKLQELADIIKQHRQEIAELKQPRPEEPGDEQAQAEAGEEAM